MFFFPLCCSFESTKFAEAMRKMNAENRSEKKIKGKRMRGCEEKKKIKEK